MTTTKGTRRRCPKDLFVPVGWRWCSYHETLHPLSEFYTTKQRISSYCQKACREIVLKRYYEKRALEGKTVQKKRTDAELTFGQQRRKAYHKRWRMKKRMERNGS